MLLGIAASVTPAFAQMNPAAPPPPAAAAGRAGQSDLHPARGTTGDHRPRRRQRRPGQGRADPPLSGSPGQAAGRTRSRHACRPSAWAAKARASSRCSTASRRNAAPVNNQIQQMRGNLDQITTSLERLRSGGIGGADRENQRRSVLTALAQNNCGPQYAAAARGPGNFIDNLFGNNNSSSLPPPSADLGAAIRHLPHRLRAHLRRRLFPGLVRHRAGALPGRREDLQGAVPGDGGDAVRLSQSRRRHQPGGLAQRPALFRAAERVQVPHRVQPVLRLQGRRARPGRTR